MHKTSRRVNECRRQQRFIFLFILLGVVSIVNPNKTEALEYATLTPNGLVISPSHPEKPPFKIHLSPPPQYRMEDPWNLGHYFLVPPPPEGTKSLGRLSRYDDLDKSKHTYYAVANGIASYLIGNIGRSTLLLGRSALFHGIRLPQEQLIPEAKPRFDPDTQFLDLGHMYARYYPTSLAVPFPSMGDIDSSSLIDPMGAAQYFVSSGIQSADVYKDIDKSSEAGFPISGDPTGDDVRRTPISFTKAGLVFKGFGASITYLQSLDQILPRHETGRRLLAGLPIPAKSFYREIDISLNYSHVLIPDVLDGTLGYNAFILPDEAFWGTNYAGEIYGTFALSTFDFLHIRPSITYSRFHSDAKQLTGGFVDTRVEVVGWTVYQRERVKIDFDPYISIGLDDGLINDGVDWTAVDVGVRIPINIGEHFIFTVDGNYGFPINGNSSSDNFRTDLSRVGIWGGCSFTIKF